MDRRTDSVRRTHPLTEMREAGYTAQDAPSMRSFHLRITRDMRTDGRTDGPTEGRTDTTSYRDAPAHLKTHTDRKGTEKNHIWIVGYAAFVRVVSKV